MHFLALQWHEIRRDLLVRWIERTRNGRRGEEIEELVKLAIVDVDLRSEFPAPVFNLELLLGLFGSVNESHRLRSTGGGLATHT